MLTTSTGSFDAGVAFSGVKTLMVKPCMRGRSAHVSDVRRGLFTVFAITRHVLIHAGYDLAYILLQLCIEPLRNDQALLRARRPKFVDVVIAFVGQNGFRGAQTPVTRATSAPMLANYYDMEKGRSGLTGVARRESPRTGRFDLYRLHRTLHYQDWLAGGDRRPCRIQPAQPRVHQIPVP